MASKIDLTELSFLVYGLGSTGKSVVNFFKKNNVKIIMFVTIIIRIYLELKDL